MVSSIFICFLMLAQTQGKPGTLAGENQSGLPSDGPLNTWTLSPVLNRAQELVYRGSYHEEAIGSRVQFSRDFRLDLRAFVIDSNTNGMEVGFLTVLKARENQTTSLGTGVNEPSGATTRMEISQVDLQGNLLSPPLANLQVPLNNAPIIETGFLVSCPKERVGLQQEWQVNEANRPPRTWSIVGKETINGASCLKLVGKQQSEDWDRPRADRTAWQRLDTLWIQPKLGYASRVERVIKLREPAQKEPNQTSTLRYELERSITFPGVMYENRKAEIYHARSFAMNATPFLMAPEKYRPQLKGLINKITQHLDSTTPTPYREVIVQTKRRLEAARKGDTPIQGNESYVSENLIAAVGYPAPDFVTTQFTSKEAARPRMFLGKPTLMVFYNPSASTAEHILTYAQKLSDQMEGRLVVLPMSVSDNSELVLKQRNALNLRLPILSGSGLRVSYAIETTPKFVLIDGNGIIRGNYLGWGHEIPTEIATEMKNWIPANTIPSTVNSSR